MTPGNSNYSARQGGTFELKPTELNIQFTAHITSNIVPVEVHFTESTLLNNIVIIEKRWDFDGDGIVDRVFDSSVPCPQTVEWTYPRWDTYPATLTYEYLDSDGVRQIETHLENVYIPDTLQTIYVAIYGSDEPGSGTIEQPYATIQKAADRANTNDTVIAMAGTYLENISIRNKSIQLLSYEGAVIDGNQNSHTVYYNNCQFGSFEGFTITNGSAGTGGGMHIRNSVIHVKDVEILNNSGTFGGGIYCTDSESIFEDVLFIDNTAVDKGGGIFFNNSDLSSFIRCSFINNTAINGGGVYCKETEIVLTNLTVSGNIAIANEGGGAIFFELYDPYNPESRRNTGAEIVNSILWDNSNPPISGEWDALTISFTNIQDGWDGVGNIDADPQLDSLYMPKWDENHYSPCIDSGDPLSTWDEDGSPPDMGAVPTINHKYDNWELPSRFTDRGWKWMSFPVLNYVTNNADPNNALPVYDGDMAEYLLAKFLADEDESDLDHVEWKPPLNNDPPREYIRYINNEWSHLDHTFTSSQGYKIWMVGQEPVSLPVSGFLADPETPIPLWADQENWVGYFLEESKRPLEAFPHDVLEHLTSITAQHWYLKKVNGVWTSHSTDGRFDYGGMYILETDADLEFQWEPATETVNPFTFTPTDNFQFEELADYTPVIIDTVENGETVEEIGIFVNDECIGAEKVTEYPVHLRAYKGNRSLENMSFEVVRQEGSGKLREGEEAVLIKESAKIHYVDVVEADNHRPVYRVSLKANEIRSIATLPVSYRLRNNYPNPFNPVTTIAYDIPEDGWVNLRVYDITGRQVDVLVNTRIKAGFHSVKWDATEFSSGLYFVSIHARGNNGGKDFTSTKKMMMIK